MKVVVIYEDIHGMIGIANNYYNAVRFLLKGWITNEAILYDERYSQWKPIEECLGKNWKEYLLDKCDINTFNDIFEDWIGLSVQEVYGTD